MPFANNEPLADLMFLRKFTKNEPEMISKYLEIFLRTTPPLMEKLADQIQKGDWIIAEQTVHGLKAQFIFIGFKTGEKLAIEIKNQIENRLSKVIINQKNKLLQEHCDHLYDELKKINLH